MFAIKKNKIIKKYKKDDYRKIMRLINESNKRLYIIAKSTRNFVTITNTKTMISHLSNESVIVTTTKKKAKLLFMTHFSSFFTMILNDIVNFDYVNFIFDDKSLTSKEMRRVIKKRFRTKHQISMTFQIK